MPPKKKFNKKSDKTVKAEARTKRGSAQAQTTNVVVKVGQPARRRKRAPAKKKSTGTGIPTSFPPEPSVRDGWLPSAVLNRSGSIFAPPTYNVPYVNPPTYPMLPPGYITSGQNLMLPPPPAPPVFAPTPRPAQLMSGEPTAFVPEPVAETPIEAPDLTDLPVSRFIRPSVSGKPLQITGEEKENNEYLVETPAPTRLFAETPDEEPTFTEISSRPPKVSVPREVRENAAAIAEDIKSILDTLPGNRNNNLKVIFGENYKAGTAIAKYNLRSLQQARIKAKELLEAEMM